jgi:hypothetical protein
MISLKQSWVHWLVCLWFIGLSGCDSITNLDRPIYFLQPTQGDVLITGEDFNLNVAVNPDNFPFQIETIEAELYSTATDASVTWLIAQPTNTGPILLNQSLRVPRDLPPADDYILSITGFAAGRSQGLGGSQAVIVVEDR